MSFPRQEEALLALLFDRDVREAFLRDRDAALAAFELTAAERADFSSVRKAGLELDAETRRELVLARLLPELAAVVQHRVRARAGVTDRLLGSSFFRVPAVERPLRYAERLRAAILAETRVLRALVTAILDLEVGMAALGADARRAAIDRGEADSTSARPSEWEARQLALAPNTGVFLLPRSYAELVRELCPCEPEQLWARLKQAGLPRRRLEHVLAAEQPRLLVVRVRVERASRCEATTSQRTVELADGFFPLLQQLASGATCKQVCDAMTRAGAPKPLVVGIRAGLEALLDQQLLTVR